MSRSHSAYDHDDRRALRSTNAAGAPEDKAQAAVRALADHERRFDHVDTELATIRGEIKALEGQVVMVKWITGATFAGILVLILRSFALG